MKHDTRGQILPHPVAAPPLQAGSALINPDELYRLFEDFSEATTQLQGAHDALLRQVDALKDELAQKNRRLERKKRLEALGRVAAGVAHEFRNPLGGMRLTVDALLREHAAESDQRRLNLIQSAIQHLDHIVQDLLLFARPGDLQRVPIAIGELVRSAYRLAFSERKREIDHLHLAGSEALTVSVDRHAFTQILLNLFLNADQAMHPLPGRIGVWWWQDEDQISIEVADEGPGVPLGDEEHIFEIFHTGRVGGTGLGLAIVQDRIEAHEGEIRLVREDDKRGALGWCGARFRISIPAKN